MEEIVLINYDWKTGVNWGCSVHAPWTWHIRTESVLSAGSVIKTHIRGMLKTASGMVVVLEKGKALQRKDELLNMRRDSISRPGS